MTEAEWLACEDPRRMLGFLKRRASERKLRLFAVACCRIVWAQVTHEPSRRAIEAAERYADGEVDRRTLTSAGRAAGKAAAGADYSPALDAAREVAYLGHEWHIATWVVQRVTRAAGSSGSLGKVAGQVRQAVLLRDLFRNPFRPTSSALAPSVLAWDGGTVPKLARAIYAGRAFDRLPVPADALEDAGSTDSALLGHLRGGGEHVRGCWALDAVLGKG